MALAAIGAIASIGSGLLGFSSSKKSAKAQQRAGREEKKRLEFNAAEVERATAINDKAFAFNIDASKAASQFNEQELRKEEADQRWRTAFNETLARRGKRRMMGSQRVAMAASSVAYGGSMTDVMRDSEIETELQIQAEVYNGLRMADKLRSQAAITKYQGEVEAWNLAFQRGEAARKGKFEAEDLRWRGKVAEMGGQAGASAAKMQGYSSLLSGAMNAASFMS